MSVIVPIKQRAVQVLLSGYFLCVAYWTWIWATGNVNAYHNYYWSLVALGAFPITGGLFGILLSRKWGFLSALLGRAIFFISVGLIMWGLGSLVFSYYNIVQNVEVPYPSLADVGFILAPPFWIIGLFNLGKGIGAGYKMRTSRGKAIIAAIIMLSLSVSYYLLLSVARGGAFDFTESGILKMTLDVLYPLFDAFLLTIIALIYGLSYQALEGRFKWPIDLLLIGFLAMYLADFSFSYTTTQGTYYSSDWVDLLFLSAMFLLSAGVNALDIQGISSHARAELLAFAPRANAAINNLVTEIIRGQARVIGPVAWDEATKIRGLNIDVKNNSLSVEGDSKEVLGILMKRHEELFGAASVEICKDAVRKELSQIPQDQLPDVLL
ncbi:MAG: hypothetical protein HYR95_02435 [Candidatus Colwellbacteria bacterium]|nr:hypothetical protein [Candidatus Colwellbacteria bacterium]MBI3274062.1 hypothetical protein [Candidatus Colwellbacteria bacterium]